MSKTVPKIIVVVKVKLPLILTLSSVLEAEKKSRGIAVHKFLTSTLDDSNTSALYVCALDGINIVK
jgi:hypothetical protein